ncbi:hypothetical protein Dimus_024704 [Dionaea muscipula]
MKRIEIMEEEIGISDTRNPRKLKRTGNRTSESDQDFRVLHATVSLIFCFSPIPIWSCTALGFHVLIRGSSLSSPARLAPPSGVRRRDSILEGWEEELRAQLVVCARKKESDLLRARILRKRFNRAMEEDRKILAKVGSRRSSRLSAPPSSSCSDLALVKFAGLSPVAEGVGSVVELSEENSGAMPGLIDGSCAMDRDRQLPVVEENGDEGVSAPLPIAIVDRRSGEGLGSSTVRVEDHFDLGEAGKVVVEPVLSTVSSSACSQVSPRCSDAANLVWADMSGGGALETVADRSTEGVEAISGVLVADAALVSLPDSFNPSSGIDSEFPVQLAGSVSSCLLADINGDVATVLSICGDTMAVNGMVSEEGLVSSMARVALRPPPTDGRRQPPMSSVEPVLVAGRDGSLPNAGGGLPSEGGGLACAGRVGGDGGGVQSS